MTYSFVANPNEKLAIQAYVAGVANENVQMSLCDNDVGDMESLINKAYKLSNTQEMNRNWAPRVHQNDQKMIDHDYRGGHLKKVEQITNQILQGNPSTEGLRATRPWQSEEHRS